MVYGSRWRSASPDHGAHPGKVNEAPAAALYTAWKAGRRALELPFRGLVQTFRRARRAGKTYQELHALSDRQLADIGLARSEIGGVAEAVAQSPRDVDLTVAELRQARPLSADSGKARVAALRREDQRQRRTAGQPPAAPADHARVTG